MIIDGVFNTLPDQIEEYQNLLKVRLSKDSNGGTYFNLKYVLMNFFTDEKNRL